MIFNIFTPHVANFGYICLKSFQRFIDRGFTKDEKKTKQIFQKNYEDLYTNIDFLMESRFSTILVNIYIIMMYSPGIPILYVIGAVIFFTTYWMDKIFCNLPLL